MSRLENCILFKCFLVVYLLSGSFSIFVFGSVLKKYEIFTATDKTKWIQVSQLEEIFSALEDTLGRMGEKQKQDSAVLTQLSSTIQSFNMRLQNVEDQLARIDRAESYNKIQLQQFSENFIKTEVQANQINHRIEKNQQQIESRLNDVDSNLEKIQKNQDNHDKEIRKVLDSQNKLTSSINDMNENTKVEYTKMMQNITFNTQELLHTLKDRIYNNTTTTQADAIKIMKIQEQIQNKNSSLWTNKQKQDDNMPLGVMNLIFDIDNKFSDLKTHVQSLDSRFEVSSNVVDKIYEKMDTFKYDDKREFLSNYFNTFLQTMKQYNDNGLEKLEGEFKKQFGIMFNEQAYFKNNCHRLQLNEEQIEDKAVEILEKLFDYIDNRTYGIAEVLTKLEMSEGIYFKNQSQEIENLRNAISFHILRNTTSGGLDLQKTIIELRNNLSFVENTLEIMQKDQLEDTKSTTQAINKSSIPNSKQWTMIPTTTAPREKIAITSSPEGIKSAYSHNSSKNTINGNTSRHRRYDDLFPDDYEEVLSQ